MAAVISSLTREKIGATLLIISHVLCLLGQSTVPIFFSLGKNTLLFRSISIQQGKQLYVSVLVRVSIPVMKQYDKNQTWEGKG